MYYIFKIYRVVNIFTYVYVNIYIYINYWATYAHHHMSKKDLTDPST